MLWRPPRMFLWWKDTSNRRAPSSSGSPVRLTDGTSIRVMKRPITFSWLDQTVFFFWYQRLPPNSKMRKQAFNVIICFTATESSNSPSFNENIERSCLFQVNRWKMILIGRICPTTDGGHVWKAIYRHRRKRKWVWYNVRMFGGKRSKIVEWITVDPSRGLGVCQAEMKGRR